MSWVGTLTRALQPRGPDTDTQTVDRMQVTLLSMFLAARAVHVGQALIDVGIARGVFADPLLAVAVAAACVVESIALATVLLRAGRIRLGAMLGDAAFGMAGLSLLGVAMSGTPGRLTSLNWMLPYTAGTAAALGLSVTGPAMRRQVITAAGACALLVATYVPSVLLFGRNLDQRTGDLVADAAVYPLFFCGGLGIAVVLSRRMTLIAGLRGQAAQAAAQASREATVASLTEAVFAPVLDIMDAVAEHPESVDAHRDRVVAVRDRIDDMALELISGRAAGRG